MRDIEDYMDVLEKRSKLEASVRQLQGYVSRLESLFGGAEVVMRERTAHGDKRVRDEAIDWLDRRESVHRDKSVEVE